MTSIKLTVTGGVAQAELSGILTAGMRGVRVQLQCDGDWDGLTRTLVCRNGVGTEVVLYAQEPLILPPAALQWSPDGRNALFLGLEGRSADGTLVLPSTMAYCGKILPGADPAACKSVGQEVPAWRQVLEKISGLERMQLQQKSDLDAAVKELTELVQRGQLSPIFVNSIDECVDQTRMYVLPDGMLYAYLRQNETAQVTRDIVPSAENPYTDNARLGSDGSVASGYSGYVTTPLIDLSEYDAPFALHLEGAALLPAAMETYSRLCLYDEKKEVVFIGRQCAGNLGSFFDLDDGAVSLDENGNATIRFSAPVTSKDGKSVRYLRLSGVGKSENTHIFVSYEVSATAYRWQNTNLRYGNVCDVAETVAVLNNEGDDPACFALLTPAVAAFYRSAAYDDDYGVTHISRAALPYRADLPLPVLLKWPHDETAVRTTVSLNTVSDVLGEGVVHRDASGADCLSVYNLLPGQRYYYRVTHLRADLSMVAAKQGSFRTDDLPWRLLCVPGTQNVRDLGGMHALDGRTVRYGRLVRGAAMDESAQREMMISDAGRQALLDTLGVRAELDLRWNKSESALGKDVAFACIPLAPYSAAITDADQRAQLRACVQWIVARLQENLPVYFHCQGGCDRTGTLAFFLLGLLGVDESDLAREYELSSFSPIGMFERVRNSTVYGYADMVRALKAFDGDTLTDRFYTFATTQCGISADTIAALRTLMLDGE